MQFEELEAIRRVQCIAVHTELSVRGRQYRAVNAEFARGVDTIAARIEFCWCGVESLEGRILEGESLKVNP